MSKYGLEFFFLPLWRKQEILINFSTVHRLLNGPVSQLPGWLSAVISQGIGYLVIFQCLQKVEK